MAKKNNSHLTFLFSGICMSILLGGCSRKYHPPVLPYAPTIEKIADNDIALIKQGSLIDQDTKKILYGAPPAMRTTTIVIENKTSKPLIVEIDRSNLSIYDTEDLAHICSKEALLNSSKNKYVFGYSVARNVIQISTGMAALAWAGFVSARWQSYAGDGLARLGWTWLPAIAIFALGSYINHNVSASQTDTLESEKELFFEQFKQMFEGTILSFDDCVEIAPYKSLKQIIFFDTEPTESGNAGQRKLVLRLTSDRLQTLVPLEL
jgi:hypothetical protein